MKGRAMKEAKGFTLIELMITVVIVGILAAIAVPQYKQYVVRGNRAAAQAFLMDIANREKQYLLDARSYTANWEQGSGTPNLGMSPPSDVSKYYTITACVDCTTGNPPSFRITATPKAGTSQASDGNLTLDDTGAKTHGAATNW
jgi:type IV pilus assembly protein PilE